MCLVFRNFESYSSGKYFSLTVTDKLQIIFNVIITNSNNIIVMLLQLYF